MNPPANIVRGQPDAKREQAEPRPEMHKFPAFFADSVFKEKLAASLRKIGFLAIAAAALAISADTGYCKCPLRRPV